MGTYPCDIKENWICYDKKSFFYSIMSCYLNPSTSENANSHSHPRIAYFHFSVEKLNGS